MSRVLVIDDDEGLCAVLETTLEQAGYDAATEIDGSRGIALQRQEPFDVAVIDIFMPGREGLETIRQLRQEFPSLKIIAMSGGGDLMEPGDYLRAASHLGAVKTLNKPFGNDVLLATIRAVLEASG